MKTKLFSILVCLFLFTNIVKAQSILSKGTNYGLISVSAAKLNTSEPSITLKGLFNHTYNEYFSLGLGAGLSYNKRAYGNDESGVYQDYSLEMPVFMNIRGNILANYDITPYYSLGIGYNIPLKRANVEYAFYKKEWKDYYNLYRISMYHKGLFITPELGISFKDISLGVEVLYGLDNYIDQDVELYHIEFGFVEVVNEDEIIPGIHVINFKLTYKL